VGSPVKFKGVTIGNVKKISIFYDKDKDLSITPVIIEIDNSMFDTVKDESSGEDNIEFYKKQIKQGLAAKLTFESIVTGKLFIELDYYASKKIRIFSTNSTKYIQIPTTPSGIDELLSSIEVIIKKISKIDFIGIFDRISSILSTADNTLSNIDLKSMVSGMTSAAKSIGRVFDSPDFSNTFKHFNDTLGSIEDFVAILKTNVNKISDKTRSTLASGKLALDKFGNMSSSINNMFREEKKLKYGLGDAIQEITMAAKSLKELADYLERNPNAIISGKANPKK
jgi:paraquat-inducible protein B